ncbi:PREDICTED: NADH dehydrogenase [ubiquinone] 1 alpha subcomplex assembly factor 5-like isoform X2 [Priapulus caudatus]|uniref:Arginine-hydroxylase NDUFAF5, mitochondrial n=1 Tax=Priapulus caudatus TaxID=37621 RepID=A0ABM1E9P4_PRICU|nr:PREDICTED: NADH dehydrogenase [ubiquinone] 1 alpha subcomplex assembly factor 5-like isoform X2 [Priapulus caudatus]
MIDIIFTMINRRFTDIYHVPNSRVLWQSQRRCASTNNVMNVFDRETKQRQKNRAAALPDWNVYEYVKEEIGWRVADRIFDVKRKFDVGVELGSGRGYVSRHVIQESMGYLMQCEMADKLLDQSVGPEDNVPLDRLVADEEFLPFKDNSLDIVVSSLSLHWVNDLPGTFKQVNNALKSDGAFIAALFGGDTLYELRCSLQMAELERDGGVSPHISPFTEARDLGGLLARTGYTLVTLDVDELRVNYPSMFELMHDLQGMGESNAAWNRPLSLKRDTLLAAASIYSEMYGNEDGTVPATFQIFYLIGWKADKSQQKPAERGSQTVSLHDLHKLDKLIDTATKTEKNIDDLEKLGLFTDKPT